MKGTGYVFTAAIMLRPYTDCNELSESENDITAITDNKAR
jgi:hypothetical protein